MFVLGTLLLGPFLQNTVQTEQYLYSNVTRKAVKGDAVLLATNRYQYANSPRGTNVTDQTMMSSVQMGWASWPRSLDSRPSMVPHQCSTGFCEWSNFSTIGVGSQCLSVGAVVKTLNGTEYGYSLASNVSTSFRFALVPNKTYFARLRIVASREIPIHSSFASRRSNLPLIAHIGAVGLINGKYQAAECVSYWAVFHYDSFLSNDTGQYQRITEFNKTRLDLRENPGGDITISGVSTCNFNGTSKPCEYTVQQQAHRGTQSLVVPFLQMEEGYTLSGPMNNTIATDFANLKVEMFWLSLMKVVESRKVPVNGSLAHELNRFMDELSLHMTNNIRSHSEFAALGKTISPGVFFKISKKYAAYPAVILFLSVVFVMATAWRTRGEPIWKNSQLALLYHGFDRVVLGDMRALSTVKEMEDKSGLTYVRLVDDLDGLGLKFRMENRA
jgi:hypothetical protein